MHPHQIEWRSDILKYESFRRILQDFRLSSSFNTVGTMRVVIGALKSLDLSMSDWHRYPERKSGEDA